jgi:hypothetical protein
MNIPSSILKSNYLPPEKIQQHQKQAKNYNKHISKYKIWKNKVNTQLRDEIITWFFSFDLITKLIISSVENKWLTNVLHQLYLLQKQNYRNRFQYRFEEPLTDKIPSFLPQGVLLNQISNAGDNTFFNYFQYKEDIRIRDERGIIDNVFLHKDINFYKTEDSNLSDSMTPSFKYSYYFSLSQRMLEDESFFREMFDSFSAGQAFMNVVPCDYDAKSKFYIYGLPQWIDTKEFYSLSVFFIAFFEQTIMTKYFLYKGTTNLQTELNGSYLTKLLGERRDLADFVRKEYKLDSFKLCESLGVKTLINEVHNDYRIKEIIQAQMKGHDMIQLHGVMCNNFVIYDNDLLTSNELEKKVKQYFGYLKKEEDILDAIIFSNFENLFTMDDFLMKRIYESLVDLYANKNAYDLMNGVYEKNNSAKKKRKSKKKPVTTTTTRTQNKTDETGNVGGGSTKTISRCDTADDKNMTVITTLQNDADIVKADGAITLGLSCFSFIKKNIKKETNDFTPGQFMGDMMMIRASSTSVSLMEENCITLIEPLVKEIVDKVLENIVLSQDNQESSEETTTTTEMKKLDDKDTAYSGSAYLSDNKSNEVFPKKKKGRNNYKLYDFKVKEKKEIIKKATELKDNSLKDSKEVDTYKRDRTQSTIIYPSGSLTLENSSSVKSSQTSTPSKANTLTSFQININPKELDVKKTYKKHESFSYPVPHDNNFYFKNHCHGGLRYYYDVPMMNNFYYFNGHNSINELFFFRFQKYIISYIDQVDYNLSYMKDTKCGVITKLEGHIMDCLSI